MADETERRDRPPLAFDLQKAIADARAEFPEETKGITFVDMGDGSIRDQLKEWLAGTDPVFRQKYMATLEAQGRDVDGWVDFCLAAGGFAIKDAASGKMLVGVRSAMPEGSSFAIEDAGRALAFIFAHELGHAIVKGGHSVQMLEMNFLGDDIFEAKAGTNKAETAADAFAALYGLRKGWLDIGDVKKMAVGNAGRAGIAESFTHFTSIALEHIVLNREDADFVSLAPQDIRAIAARHAEEFSLETDAYRNTESKIERVTRRALKAALDAKGPPSELEDEDDDRMRLTLAEDWDVHLKALADIYTRGLPPRGGNPIPYFIAKTVLAETLKTGKVPGMSAGMELSGAYWDGVRKLMEERASTDAPSALLDVLAQNKRDMLELKASKGAAPAVALSARSLSV